MEKIRKFPLIFVWLKIVLSLAFFINFQSSKTVKLKMSHSIHMLRIQIDA